MRIFSKISSTLVVFFFFGCQMPSMHVGTPGNVKMQMLGPGIHSAKLNDAKALKERSLLPASYRSTSILPRQSSSSIPQPRSLVPRALPGGTNTLHFEWSGPYTDWDYYDRDVAYGEGGAILFVDIPWYIDPNPEITFQVWAEDPYGDTLSYGEETIDLGDAGAVLHITLVPDASLILNTVGTAVDISTPSSIALSSFASYYSGYTYYFYAKVSSAQNLYLFPATSGIFDTTIYQYVDIYNTDGTLYPYLLTDSPPEYLHVGFPGASTFLVAVQTTEPDLDWGSTGP